MQASPLVEPVRAVLLCYSVCPVEPDVVVTLSSSDEALELLFLSPTHVSVSHVVEPSSNSDSDLFEDWPEANDTTTSVYVALTMDVLSSHSSTINAPRGD
jgi:hypothetical protein